MTAFSTSFPSGLDAGVGAQPYRIGALSGTAAHWHRGPSEALSARIAALPAQQIVAALPFDRKGDGVLLSELTPALPDNPAKAPGPQAQLLSHRPLPAPEAYAAAVAEATRRLRAEPDFRKVVLARCLELTFDRTPDIATLLEALSRHPVALPYMLPVHDPASETPRHLVGASPELLLAREGSTLRSHPLAGSARRSGDRAADSAAAQALSGSAKDQGEHALVVEHICDLLAPLCKELQMPRGPQIFTTDSMIHLGTPIRGLLRGDDHSAFDLARLLHPTPAVGGTDLEKAEDCIARLEPFSRGFFAGAVGQQDARGNGAFHVAIRCAEIAGTRARLFAGAGIVADSDPLAETAETGAKFGTMLRALGCGDLGCGDLSTPL
ncbi:isochorismate synthase MenF [Pseudooceanicola sp. HF7]|uniref:isochorismate synthase n=1 Tax=Pseudooceanicola sp. HF7 TaxID=2721560 RepID=UPI00142F9202|nr:isochorismate synthase [Pseudooceanicola sp. HF7]NIZ10573.1 isochorismate synthase [Pseudooceanicola sp. HF7]